MAWAVWAAYCFFRQQESDPHHSTLFIEPIMKSASCSPHSIAYPINMSTNTDNFSLLSETPRVISDLIDVDASLHTSSLLSEPSSNDTASARAEITTDSVNLPTGYHLAPLGRHLKTAWVWQHGWEVVRSRDALHFWLCKLC